MDVSLSDSPADVPVRAGEEQDWPALERYLRGAIPGLRGSIEVRQFPKGYANLTYLVTFGETRLVVRRPPFGRLARGAHDMGREYRALAGLSPVYRPAPHPYLYCDDASVIGAPFLVMEYREGIGVWDSIPLSMERHDRVAERIAAAAVGALARLHRLDVQQPGLRDLGRAAGFVDRQLSGWLKRWELVATNDVPEMQRAADVLAASIPASDAAGVLHNDFKLDNCQFDPSNPDEVASVFDWDQAALGDPLIDLGILLNYWPDPSDDPSVPWAYPNKARSIGLPSRSVVLSIYAEQTGYDVERISWYEAFAAWKTAVVQQQLVARFQRGESTDPRMARLVPSVRAMAQRSLLLLEKDRR